MTRTCIVNRRIWYQYCKTVRARCGKVRKPFRIVRALSGPARALSEAVRTRSGAVRTMSEAVRATSEVVRTRSEVVRTMSGGGGMTCRTGALCPRPSGGHRWWISPPWPCRCSENGQEVCKTRAIRRAGWGRLRTGRPRPGPPRRCARAGLAAPPPWRGPPIPAAREGGCVRSPRGG